MANSDNINSDGITQSVWQTTWLRLAIVLLILTALIIIWIWPHKTGDTRIGDDGKVEIYWRGPNPAEPGRWLPRADDVNQDTIINCRVAVGTRLGGRLITDCVPIGGGRCIIVLDDIVAAIVKSQ